MKFLTKYFIIYVVFALGLVIFLRWHKLQAYSEKELQEILLTPSRYKETTDNPCLYSIIGEPTTPGQYLKLTFKCQDKEARFSLDFGAIKERTVGGVIGELFRIGGVTLGIERLRCKQGGRSVKMSDPIVAQDNIECRYE